MKITLNHSKRFKQLTLNNTDYYKNIKEIKNKKTDYTDLFFDLETEGLGGKLIIGAIINQYDKINYFTSFKELFKVTENYEGNNFILYSHNGGKYDNRYLFNYLYKNNIDVFDIILINNALLFSFYIGNKKIILRDTYLILKSSLKSLCNDFLKENEKHLAKKELNIEKWINEGCKITSELKEYLKFDVISLKTIFNNFKTVFSDVNTDYLTIASISFNHLLNTEYKNKSIHSYTKNYFTEKQENDIRNAYYGGRNEIFKFKCKSKIYNYDINSLYPYAFSQNYPLSNTMIYLDNENDIIEYLNEKCLGILNVNIDYNYSYIPILPYRFNNKLLFVYGNNINNVYITNLEYEILKQNKSNIEINYAYIYLQKEPIFKNFVEKYYEIKKNSKGAKRLLSKFFLNSCYGKYGMNRNRDKIININMLSDNEINYYKNNWKTLIENKPYRIIKECNYSNRKINVLYAIFTTSYARSIMYKYLNEYANNLYYTDTDCLYVDTKINNDYIDNNELGKFKLENTMREAIFISNKFYATIDENNKEYIKIKGIFKEKIKDNEYQYIDKNNKIIDYETLEKLQENKIDKIEFKNNRLLGFLENFKRIEYRNNIDIQNIQVNKNYINNYDKRIINGNNTLPYNINDLLIKNIKT